MLERLDLGAAPVVFHGALAAEGEGVVEGGVVAARVVGAVVVEGGGASVEVGVEGEVVVVVVPAERSGLDGDEGLARGSKGVAQNGAEVLEGLRRPVQVSELRGEDVAQSLVKKRLPVLAL